jgi:rubrerythrin
MTMPILTPTAATGARSVPQPMTYVDPARTLPAAEHESFLEGTGMNGPFVADLLSNMAAHERAGVMLYRSVAERTHNPVLQQRYRHFGNETVEHVDILQALVTQLGGDPNYVSPAARATEKSGLGLLESTFLLTGSVDLMTQELVMLDAVLLAEAKDHANWSCLSALVADMPDGEVRTAFEDAVDQVGPQEDEHHMWAQEMRCKMISAQARSSSMQAVGEKAEELVARIQGLFS